jgi:ATP-dependent Clp protease adaptor protein ClpS
VASEVEQLLEAASQVAQQRNHQQVGIDHAVMAIIARSQWARLLEACGARLGKLADELDRYLDDRPLLRDREPLQVTPELAGSLQRAANYSKAATLADITVGNLIVAMLAERQAFSVVALARHGVTRLGMMSYLIHGAVHDSVASIPQARLVSRWKPWARGARAAGRDARPAGPVADRCEIVMHDDPYTQMEFVIDVLMSVFDHDREDAQALMLAIHERGSGIVGTCSFALATALVAEVTERARDLEFPLRVSVEPVSASSS